MGTRQERMLWGSVSRPYQTDEIASAISGINPHMRVMVAGDVPHLVLDGMEYDIDHVRAALAEYARMVEAGEIL